MRMKLYKVEAELYGCFLTAVVACEKENYAVEIAGFDSKGYENQEIMLIGESVYTEQTLVCQESL